MLACLGLNSKTLFGIDVLPWLDLAGQVPLHVLSGLRWLPYASWGLHLRATWAQLPCPLDLRLLLCCESTGSLGVVRKWDHHFFFIQYILQFWFFGFSLSEQGPSFVFVCGTVEQEVLGRLPCVSACWAPGAVRQLEAFQVHVQRESETCPVLN